MTSFEEFEAKSLSEDYGMTETRPIEVIEGEILFYKAQAGGAILEIGRRLIEAKEQLAHGQWLGWLEEKVQFSARTAQRFMKLAKGYRENDTLTHLGARKALVLLELEEAEREEFAAEMHEVNGAEKTVEDMTAEELEEAVRLRKEAQMAAEKAEADRQVAEAGKAKLEAEMVLANGRIKAAEAEKAKLQKKIKELESRPVEVAVQVDEAAVEKARKDGAAQAKKEAEEKAGKELRDLRSRLEAAEQDAREARSLSDSLKRELAGAEKQNRMAGKEELVKFNIHFHTAQEQAEEMSAILRSLREAGETGLAEKLGSAMRKLAELIVEMTEE